MNCRRHVRVREADQLEVADARENNGVILSVFQHTAVYALIAVKQGEIRCGVGPRTSHLSRWAQLPWFEERAGVDLVSDPCQRYAVSDVNP